MRGQSRTKASHRLHARRTRRAQKRYALIGALSIILISGALYGIGYLLRLPSVSIDGVSISGAQSSDPHAIQTLAESALLGSRFFLFPNDSILFYPKGTIERMVAASDTRIEGAIVTREGKELTVTISEHKPTYIWCDSLAKGDVDEKCFFAASDGYVFAEAPQFSGSVYIIFRGPLSGTGTDPRGKYILPKEQFAKITQFLSALSAAKVSVESVSAMGEGDYAARISSGSDIRFSITQDIATLSANLAAAASVLSDKKAPEYIDLRFGNKIFYK